MLIISQEIPREATHLKSVMFILFFFVPDWGEPCAEAADIDGVIGSVYHLYWGFVIRVPVGACVSDKECGMHDCVSPEIHGCTCPSELCACHCGQGPYRAFTKGVL